MGMKMKRAVTSKFCEAFLNHVANRKIREAKEMLRHGECIYLTKEQIKQHEDRINKMEAEKSFNKGGLHANLCNI